MISLVLAGFGLTFFALADFARTAYNSADLGPNFYPRLISLLLLSFSVMQLIISIRRKGKEEFEAIAWRLVGGVFLLIFGYVLLWETGYVWLNTVFILILMIMGGARKWWVLLTTSAGYTALSYYVFARILNVPLP
ncbi:tripartite tricarboxylate transporter TctB family protein [Caldinitratiruptor microaerophilus]|uniref:tripartite tricarboxylate transporter TctB family protein n=1 Tax=Caldinitratiruptor microaerophilus TaxID=671077 RepID=UPI0022326EED|nr:tripartite tricarboxylate transporter TctB family protein [Caldinitratiruptor microaerophilus]